MTEATQIDANTIDRKTVEKVKSELKKAHQTTVSGTTKYRDAAKHGLETSEGMLALCEFAAELKQSYGDDKKSGDKALRALNNAVQRVCEEQEDAPILTINQKTEDWLSKSIAHAETDSNKYMVLIVKPERAKAEVSPEDAFFQEAVNEYRKAMRDCEKDGSAPDVLKNYLDAVAEAGKDWLITLQETAAQSEQKAA